MRQMNLPDLLIPLPINNLEAPKRQPLQHTFEPDKKYFRNMFLYSTLCQIGILEIEAETSFTSSVE